MPPRVKKCFICTNTSQNAPNKLFLWVPENRTRRRMWFEAVSYPVEFLNRTNLYCCEDHFDLPNDAENWGYYQQYGGKIILKSNSLPCKTTSTSSESRHTIDHPSGVKTSTSSPTPQKRPTESTNNGMVKKKILISHSKLDCGTSSVKNYRTDMRVMKFSQWCEDISKETILNVELFKLKNNSRLLLGVSDNNYNVVDFLQKHTKLPLLYILITLKKLHTNDNFQRIGADFACNTSFACYAFNKTLYSMAALQNKLIIWPEAENIKKLFPNQSVVNKNVDAILDCFEITIEQSSAAFRKDLTWNKYKNCYTLKYLISMCPNGWINFISKGYSSHVSDKELLILEQYINMVPLNVTIIVDRGFKEIEKVLASKKIKIVRSARDFGRVNNTTEDKVQMKVITTLRANVESVIRSFREFSILRPYAPANHNLTPTLDCIVASVCGLLLMEKESDDL